jgi:hypothetical protein
MSDGIGHRYHGKAKGQRNAEETDPQFWISGGDDGAAAAPKYSQKYQEVPRSRACRDP